MNSNELPPDPIPTNRLTSYFGPRTIPFRHFVVGVVALGMAMFTWYRTGGDVLLSTVVAAMTAAAVDVRVSDRLY